MDYPLLFVILLISIVSIGAYTRPVHHKALPLTEQQVILNRLRRMGAVAPDDMGMMLKHKGLPQ